jgi:hypothetical protein
VHAPAKQERMPELDATLTAVLADRYFANLARVRELAAPLTEKQFWTKPFSYGNSFGHLVLHLTGNLNHYVGAKIAATGYVRDRPREFTDAAAPAAETVLANFHAAVAMVERTIRSLGDDGLMAPIADEPPVQTRFGLLLVCAAHLNNHVGQMSYLVQAQGHSTQEPPVW